MNIFSILMNADKKFNFSKINESQYQLQLLVPGFKLTELDIQLNNDYLTIKGVKVPEQEVQKDIDRIVYQFDIKDFEYKFRLQYAFNDISAKLHEGILYITFNLDSAIENSKKIEITT